MKYIACPQSYIEKIIYYAANDQCPEDTKYWLCNRHEDDAEDSCAECWLNYFRINIGIPRGDERMPRDAYYG